MWYSDPFIDYMLLLTGLKLLCCQCWRNYLLSSQHISDILQWNIRGIVLRMSNDGFSELFLLLSKIWWCNIIDIREQLLEWRFFFFLCHLNHLQKLLEEINKTWYKLWPSKTCWTMKKLIREVLSTFTCFFMLLLSSDSSSSLHQPFLSTHFLNLFTGFRTIFQYSISSTDRYFVESSDVEWWPTLYERAWRFVAC